MTIANRLEIECRLAERLLARVEREASPEALAEFKKHLKALSEVAEAFRNINPPLIWRFSDPTIDQKAADELVIEPRRAGDRLSFPFSSPLPFNATNLWAIEPNGRWTGPGTVSAFTIPAAPGKLPKTAEFKFLFSMRGETELPDFLWFAVRSRAGALQACDCEWSPDGRAKVAIPLSSTEPLAVHLITSFTRQPGTQDARFLGVFISEMSLSW